MGIAFLIVTLQFGVPFSKVIEKEKDLFEESVWMEVENEKIKSFEGIEMIDHNNIKLSVQFLSTLLTIFGVAIAFFSFAFTYLHRYIDEENRKKVDEELRGKLNEIENKLDLTMKQIITNNLGIKRYTNSGFSERIYIPENTYQLSIDLKEAIQHYKIKNLNR
ncbi:hypothetical protein ACTHO0_24740 [Cytobacillus praedii]|uniref:hypothetical protein n=1 Tax=Cytobacillus praedii TaxID=1742358 RepID=UPI003F7DF21C